MKPPVQSHDPELLQGMSLHRQGRWAEAIQCYQSVLEKNPSNTDVMQMLGAALAANHQPREAVEVLREVATLKPNDAVAHFNLGVALEYAGLRDDAIEAYRAAIALDQALFQAHTNLAKVFGELKEWDSAAEASRHALRLNPNDPAAHYNYSVALRRKNPDEAEPHARLAAESADAPAITLFNHAIILAQLARDPSEQQQALELCRVALARDPNRAEAWQDAGFLFAAIGRHDEALHAYEQAVALAPHHALHRANLARARIMTGDWSRGWPEMRWQREHYHQLGLSTGDPGGLRGKPEWDGKTELAGKTVLIQGEEGLGDQILFLCYANELAALGAKIVASVDGPLVRLFRTMPEISEVLPSDQPPPKFDVFTWMMDLPGKLGTSLNQAPAKVPYLTAPPDTQAAFAQRVATDGARLRVGIAWAGNPKHTNDRERSLPIEALSGLTAIEGVVFYQLHKTEQRQAAPKDLALHDWTSGFKDLSDTAALIANLDVIISVDTAVAHLAGAMGREVWTLLPFNADFRWLTNREDSVWYPTMRLFRQQRPRDWAGVIERVRGDLKSRISTV